MGQVSDLLNHAKGKKHQDALQTLGLQDPEGQGDGQVAEDDNGNVHGICSGLSLKVPRMDTWISVLNSVLSRASFLATTDKAANIGSGLLCLEADSSATVSRKILQCLRFPLDQQDMWHLKNAVAASIALDRGEGFLIVHARVLSRRGLYDTFLGIDGGGAVDADNPDASLQILQALKRVIARAVTSRGDSRRSSLYAADDEQPDLEVFKHFTSKVLSMVADGGPCEQRALYEADRSHRLRSVEKLFWKRLPDTFDRFWQSLLTGKHSLASFLENSEKFSQAFMRKQSENKAAAQEDDIVSSASFVGLIKSLSFADHRFDSRKRPLFRLFKLFITVLDLLEDIASQGGQWDREDRNIAVNLLTQIGGDTGFCTCVSAAVIADTMLLGWPMLKVCDQDASDFSLAGPMAAKTLATLKHFLYDGAIWLPQAKDTLTHAVLSSIRDRAVFVGRGSITANQGRQRAAWLFYAIFEAFFKSHFPGYEEANLLGAFNLTVEMSLSDRQRLFLALCERLGLNGSAAWQSMVGSGPTTGLLQQARYWSSDAGLLVAGQEDQSKLVCHLPQSPHQRAWLRTWQGARKNASHAAALKVIEFYLSSLAGTGTVERSVGQLGSLLSRRAGLHERTVEAMMKMLQQDEKGRRTTRLDPKQLLTKEGPRRTAGQAIVLHPASAYLLRVQKRYALWFGERAAAAWSLEVPTLQELAVQQAKAKRPRLYCPSPQHANSEKAQLEAHAASCMTAIAAVKTDVGPDTMTVLGKPLGIVPSGASHGDLMSSMAEEAWEMRKRRKTAQSQRSDGIEPQALEFYGQHPSSGAASSQSLPSTPCGMRALLASQSGSAQDPDANDGLDWSKGVKAVAKQAEVAEKMAQAQILAVPGQPAAFVDSKGGRMLPKPDTKAQPEKVPQMPFRPVVIIRKGAEEARTWLPKPFNIGAFPGSCDVVLVPSVTSSSAEALLARLEGARLIDVDHRCVQYRGSSKQHHLFYVQDCFARAYPKHTEVLLQCSIRSPMMRTGGVKVPRLTVQRSALPEEMKWPDRSFQLVRSLADGGQRMLDLEGLLQICGRCYGPVPSAASGSR
ncbi:unnamed protein product [Symbiodinium sp. CCMP2592]|nr:unnamed protein product [Symbiodinium sp. CCMP2592]